MVTYHDYAVGNIFITPACGPRNLQRNPRAPIIVMVWLWDMRAPWANGFMSDRHRPQVDRGAYPMRARSLIWLWPCHFTLL